MPRSSPSAASASIRPPPDTGAGQGNRCTGIGRRLLTSLELIIGKQKIGLVKAFTAREAHVTVQITYRVDQGLIDTDEQSRRRGGQMAAHQLVRSISTWLPRKYPSTLSLFPARSEY